MRTNWATRFVPGLEMMARYERPWLRMDLVAGLSVAAVAVPTAIAIGQIAGAVYELETGKVRLLP